MDGFLATKGKAGLIARLVGLVAENQPAQVEAIRLAVQPRPCVIHPLERKQVQNGLAGRKKRG